MNLPNLISIGRFALAPLIMWLMAQGEFGWALAVFLIGCFSDGVDGFLARHLNQMTELGAALDPVADKVLINTPLIVMAGIGAVPYWLCFIVLGRDILIIIGYLCLKLSDNLEWMKVNLMAKATTSVQMGFTALVMWTLQHKSYLADLIPLLALFCAALTLLSGLAYLWGILKHLTHRA